MKKNRYMGIVPTVVDRRARKELGQVILTASIGRHNGSMSVEKAAEYLVEGAKGLMRKRGLSQLLSAWDAIKDSIEKDKYVILQQTPGGKTKVRIVYEPLKEFVQKLS